MNEDRPRTSKKSWLEKVADAFTGEPKDRDDLISILKDSQEKDILDSEAFSIILGALNVADKHVREIMVPRSKMHCIDEDESFVDLMQTVVQSGHSRFPVISESGDEILGILLAKDLLTLVAENNFDPNVIEQKWKDVLRPVKFVPESKRLNILLNEFRSKRRHMAIVLDEYSSFSGLVTIEDVLEEIVGEIEDEHDDEEDAFIVESNNDSHCVDALTPIDDFNQHFNTEFTSDEFETIGGIVAHKFGRLPKREESVQIDHLLFKVTSADDRRIRTLEVYEVAHQ